MTTSPRPVIARPATALQVLSVLTALSLAWQFVTAGRLVPRRRSGLTAVAAVLAVPGA